MTEKELKVELMCYKEFIDPNCDIDNMTKEEMDNFYKLYIKSEDYFKSLKKNTAKIIK